ncbi:hypothetical protein D1817_12620 [Flavobacteriaceae bacterium]|nr:hypothetical protein D1817_12620 [Flavobacteriaceae bacterium]
MKFKYITYLFFIFCIVSFSQNKERIEISGQIIVDSLDVEGVTIFNTTASSGSISDNEGKFTIKVYLNDILEISALQFQKITLTIDEKILKSKSVTIVLIEQVNDLPEVVILPFGLSGNINEDIANAKILNPNYDALYFGLANLDEFEFLEDNKDAVRNTEVYGREYINGVDVIGLVGLFLKSKNKDNDTEVKNDQNKETLKNRLLNKKYTEDFYINTVGISKNEVSSFVYFVELNGFDKSLLNDKREFDFLDFILKQRNAFQKIKNVKN